MVMLPHLSFPRLPTHTHTPLALPPPYPWKGCLREKGLQERKSLGCRRWAEGTTEDLTDGAAGHLDASERLQPPPASPRPQTSRVVETGQLPVGLFCHFPQLEAGAA